MSSKNQIKRKYIEVFNDLYDYSRVSIENSLKPLKEYYFFNPHDFNTRDPKLMEKAIKFVERVKEKVERYRENNERDKEL